MAHGLFRLRTKGEVSSEHRLLGAAQNHAQKKLARATVLHRQRLSLLGLVECVFLGIAAISVHLN